MTGGPRSGPEAARCGAAARTVGIIGAGRIAQGFDTPDSPDVLTLAHAVRRTPALTLGGFFDADPERAAAAETTWGCPATPRERCAWLDRGWDVIVIATPEREHARDLRDALARKPAAIVVEKPVATDPDEGTALLCEAERLGIAVIVDYPRRWHSGVVSLARHVESGRLGAPRAVIFAGSGEPVRSATHMLDLFHTCWGGGFAMRPGSRIGAMATVTLRRDGFEIPMSLVELPAGAHYVWEMHVHCERGKVELSRSPEVLEISAIAPHPRYPSFDVLTPLERHDMEAEPLLCRLMDAVAAAAADPEAARLAVKRELESHAFGASVLACVEGGR